MWREPEPYPIATSGVGGDIAAAVQALMENADRLQLTWRMLPATVVQLVDVARIIVETDGLGLISAVSLIDRNVGIGDRVMVLLVPNAHFLIGVIGDRNALVKLSASTTQSIPDSTFTPATFNIEDIDTHNGHNTTNNTRYTAVVPGWYQVNGGTNFAGNATGRRGIRWLVNGVLPANASNGWEALYSAIATSTTSPAPAPVIPLRKGDYLEMALFQSSGGALNAGSASGQNRTWMQANWVRPL